MRRFPEFYILRHGETEWNRAGRMQGALDSPLTSEGRAQAERQGAILARLDLSAFRWVSSPQGRAMDTARIAARGRVIETDPRLAEIGVGDWTGLARAEIAARAPHLADSFEDLSWYDHAPGGEGIVALEARVSAFIVARTTPTIVVTHGITSRVMRCLLQGMPGDAYASLTGGQGVVYHVKDGQQERLG